MVGLPLPPFPRWLVSAYAADTAATRGNILRDATPSPGRRGVASRPGVMLTGAYQVLNIRRAGVLDAEKILITGATGKIAFPIARALAPAGNEVWGAARLKDPAGRQKLVDAGVNTVAVRHRCRRLLRLCPTISPTFSMPRWTPAPTTGPRCVETNAHNSGELLYHCRAAKGFVFCSTGSIYAYQGQRPLTRDRSAGGAAAARTTASPRSRPRRCAPGSPSATGIPLTIIRICSTYGPQGGAPADRLDMMLAGKPIRLHPDKPEQLQPDLRRRLRRTRHPRHGGRRHAADRRELGGQRDRQRRGLLHVHGRAGRRRADLRVHPEAHTPLWPDVTHMHEVLGRTKVPWRDGFRRMIAARHPEIDCRMIRRD